MTHVCRLPLTAGQERNTFARVGNREFAFLEDNPQRRTETWELDGVSENAVQVFNRNPGRPDGPYDDNPAYNRGLSLTFEGP